MNIFLVYALNLSVSSIVGVTVLSWFQNLFLHGDTQLFLETFPTTLIITILLVAVFLLISFFIQKPLLKLFKQIKEEERFATDEEQSLTVAIERKINLFTILADFTIFVIGFIIAYFIEIANGSFDFEISKTILYILQAWGFAAVCAMNTIYLTSTELIKFKKNLKITSLAQKKISNKITTKIATLTSVSLIFVSINLFCIGYQPIYCENTSHIDNLASFYFIQNIKIFILSVLICLPSLYCVLKHVNLRMKRNIEKLEELSTNADLSEQINIELFDDFGYMTSVTNNLISSMGKMIAALKSETDQVEESAQVLSDVATTSASANNLMSETFERINNETLRQNELIMSVSNDVSSLTESANNLKEYMLSESSAMQQNSASIAEMTANINSMANMTKKADAMFDELTQTSEEGNKLVAQAVTSISEIQKASKEVQSIVKTIQEIASQTNLLSMNAAIEAAHAGEFGTGFAVVADEVRSLATSSATSAKEIQAHIKDIVSKINVGVEAISSAGSAFKNIDQGVSENRELIKSLALAMEEQRIGAEETMKVTVEVTDALEKANELVHEQNEYAANVRTAMDNVVNSAAEVSRVIKDGNAATDNINDAVQMIAQTSEQNNDVVRSMKEQINIYKV